MAVLRLTCPSSRTHLACAPLKIPSRKHILPAASMSVETKEFHVFVSYRVKSEAALAEKLTDKCDGEGLFAAAAWTLDNVREQNVGQPPVTLQLFSLTEAAQEKREVRIKVFLDKQNLTAGELYQTQFLSSLKGSCLFLPLISEECLEPILRMQEGSLDNVLLEWETALALQQASRIEIIPILIGKAGPTGYSRFSAFTLPFPAVPSGSCKTRTVADTIKRMFEIQGVFLDPSDVTDKLSIIVERLSKDIWPRFRNQWKDQSSLGPEPVFSCVQCGSDYVESQNGEGACRFHSGLAGYGGNSCCGTTSTGCQRSKHTNRHHNRFKYEAFFSWVNALTSYTGSTETFCSVIASDWTDDSGHIRIQCGSITGELVEHGKFFVWITESFSTVFFLVFSERDIEQSDIRYPIANIETARGYVARVTWVTNELKVTGVRLECSTPSLPCPFVSEVYFAWPLSARDDTPVVSEVREISKPTFGEARPSKPYSIPASLEKGPSMKLPRPRTARKFEPWRDHGSSIRLKIGDTRSTYDRAKRCDVYTVNSLTLINPGKEVIGILDVAAYWRVADTTIDPTLILGEDGGDLAEWRQLEGAQVAASVTSNQSALPCQVPARAALNLKVSSLVPCQKDAQNGNLSWSVRGWHLRHTPILIHLVVEDLEGFRSGIIVEFVCPPVTFNPNLSPSTLCSVAVNDMVEWNQYRVQLKKYSSYENYEESVRSNAADIQYPGAQDTLFQLSAEGVTRGLSTGELRRYTLQAIAEGKQEVPIPSNTNRLSLFALVDHNTRSVYAVRVEVTTDSNQTIGFLALAPYGDALLPDALVKEPSAPITYDYHQDPSFRVQNVDKLIEYTDPVLGLVESHLAIRGAAEQQDAAEPKLLSPDGSVPDSVRRAIDEQIQQHIEALASKQEQLASQKLGELEVRLLAGFAEILRQHEHTQGRHNLEQDVLISKFQTMLRAELAQHRPTGSQEPRAAHSDLERGSQPTERREKDRSTSECVVC
ncbi:uncharacterized protein BJ171DRAFT_568428 [Polychytrium aggregatum]|uniref:uncharacterized protein n=1 Tax=Polychytrium aggregatum TaxID=110093 RepID=UPI0022FDF439|nr:uncharacterized protein BJ171DRAFT_568428 [Polychytrium aggregatum]KAI9203940.1 hypothetical protein BJ171DRAFT_568428 [Polychytrium aggregatum]